MTGLSAVRPRFVKHRPALLEEPGCGRLSRLVRGFPCWVERRHRGGGGRTVSNGRVSRTRRSAGGKWFDHIKKGVACALL